MNVLTGYSLDSVSLGRRYASERDLACLRKEVPAPTEAWLFGPPGRSTVILQGSEEAAPRSWLLSNGLQILIGGGNLIVLCANGSPREFDMDGQIFEVIPTDQGYLVISEIGASLLDLDLDRQVWSIATDVLSDWSVSATILSLTEMEGAQLDIDISTGRKLEEANLGRREPRP